MRRQELWIPTDFSGKEQQELNIPESYVYVSGPGNAVKGYSALRFIKSSGLHLQSSLFFKNASGNYVKLTAPSTLTNYDLFLPTTSGSIGQALVQGASGQLAWSNIDIGNFVDQSTTLELSGSTGLTITPSGAQDLSTNRTWNLTLSSNLQAYSSLPTGTFALSGHTHNSQYLQIANNLSDLASASAARDNLNLGTNDTPNFLNLSLGSGTSYLGTNLSIQDSWGGNYNGTNTLGEIIFRNNAAGNVGIAAEVAGARGLNVAGAGQLLFRTASASGVLNDIAAFSHTGNLLLGDSTFIQGTAGIARLQIRSSSALMSLENAAGTVRFSVANAGTILINAGLSQDLPLSLNSSNQLVAETAATTRSNLGLGTAAQQASGTFALASHTHAASSITSGTFDNARVSSGNVTQHEGSINHDNLSGFVGSEHIDHSSVSITAGLGLSGGGDLTTTRTINLANTTISSGTYGSSTQVPQFTVDAQGRLTNASNVTITASGLGAVTSVGLSAPSIFNVTNSPITGSGTLTLTLANQSSGTVFAGPVSGSSANPAFRLLVSDDIPSLAISKIANLQTSLDSKLATGAVINALAGLDSSTGLVLQNSASSFSKLATGTFATSGHTHADLIPTTRTLQFTGGNSITVTSSAAQDLSSNRSWTIDTIQDIRTTATPTFNSVLVGAGSVSIPSISFSGDTNTGLYNISSDTLAVAAGGSLVARFDSNGMGVGTGPSSTYSLNVYKTGTDTTIGTTNFVSAPIKNNTSSSTAFGTVSLMQAAVLNTGILNAFNFYVHQNSSYVASGITNAGLWAGGYFIAEVNNSNHRGTIATTMGNYVLHGFGSAATSSGSVTNSYGVRVQTNLNGVGTIGSYFQLYLGKSGSTTTITGTRYGIYQLDTDAINYFGGQMLFGSTNHTANTVAYFDGSRYLKSSSVTFTELGYLSGVTSAIQTQLNTKVASSLTLQITGNGITVTSSAALSLSANRTWGLALTNTGVSSGTYGNATTIPQVTIGADGRITAASGVAVDIVSDYGDLTGKPTTFAAIPVTGTSRYDNFSFIWAPASIQLVSGNLIPVGQWLEVPYNPHDSSSETFDIERFHAMVYSPVGTTAATSIIKIQVSSNPATGFTDIASSTLTLTSTGGYSFPTATTTGITQTVTSGQYLAIYVVSSTDNDTLGYGSEHEQLKCHIMLRAT